MDSSNQTPPPEKKEAELQPVLTVTVEDLSVKALLV
jgi:hypothetical protein